MEKFRGVSRVAFEGKTHAENMSEIIPEEINFWIENYLKTFNII